MRFCMTFCTTPVPNSLEFGIPQVLKIGGCLSLAHVSFIPGPQVLVIGGCLSLAHVSIRPQFPIHMC